MLVLVMARERVYENFKFILTRYLLQDDEI